MDSPSDSTKSDSSLTRLLYIAAALLIGRVVGALLDKWLWHGAPQKFQTEQDAVRRFNRRLSIEEARQRLFQALSDLEQLVCEPAATSLAPLPATQ